MKDKKKILGKIIRDVRTIRDVTQGSLCNSVEISQSVLSKIELGKATIEIDNYRKILSFFNLNYDTDLEIEKQIDDICDSMFKQFGKLSNKSIQEHYNELLVLKEKNHNIIYDYKIKLFLCIPEILEAKSTDIINEVNELIKIFEQTDDELYIISQLLKVFYLISKTHYQEAKEILYMLDKHAKMLDLYIPLITFDLVFIEILLNNKLIAIKLLSRIQEGCVDKYPYSTSMNIVYFCKGFLFQQNEEYEEALKYYELMDENFINNLFSKLMNFYIMNKTYCTYKLGNHESIANEMINLISESELHDPLIPLFFLYRTSLKNKDMNKVKEIMELGLKIDKKTYGKHLFNLENLRNKDLNLFYYYIEINLLKNQHYKNHHFYFKYILELRDYLWKNKQYTKFKVVTEYLVENI